MPRTCRLSASASPQIPPPTMAMSPVISRSFPSGTRADPPQAGSAALFGGAAQIIECHVYGGVEPGQQASFVHLKTRRVIGRGRQANQMGRRDANKIEV